MKKAFYLVAMAGCLAAFQSGPVLTPSLCQLAEDREAYAGRSVTVDGYLLVSRHGTAIVDPRCGLGIGIVWDVDEPRMRDFAAGVPHWYGPPAMVHVRVTGEVKLGNGDSISGERPWDLNLTAGEILSSRQLSDDDKGRYSNWLEGPSSEPFRPSR